MNQELLSKFLNGGTAEPKQEPTAEEPRALFRQAWPWALAPALIIFVTLLIIRADVFTLLSVTGSIFTVGAAMAFILAYSEK